MRPGRMAEFLNGGLSSRDLEAELSVELQNWTRSMSERGRAAHIVVEPAHPQVQITARHVEHFLREIVSARLSLEAGAYLVDALLISDAFGIEGRDLIERLEVLSETQHKGALSIATVREVIDALHHRDKR
jgi:hypothetical protein